ncbi:hypothetical protein UlMin_004622 [Ulmus minor]
MDSSPARIRLRNSGQEGNRELGGRSFARLQQEEDYQGEDEQINEEFPEEQLLAIRTAPWSADYANYLVKKILPPELSFQQKRKFFFDLKHYFWDEPYLYKHCANQIIRRCVPEEEMESILHHCHSREVGGHFGGTKTATKVLQSGFYWPSLFKDVFKFVSLCDDCQRSGNILRRHEMPLNTVALPTNDGWVVVKFLMKNIFTRFGTPRAIISDGGSHFCNSQFEAVLAKYGVTHRVATPYHPQTSGQVEVSN